MDQMKRAMEEMTDSMRRVNHMDDLVQRTESAFVASITSHPLPSKFKMPAWICMTGCVTLVITLPCSRQPCIFKVFQMKLCAEPFLQF